MAKVEPMDSDFAGWMSEFEIVPDTKILAARWKTFQAITVNTSTKQTECWVKLAFETQRLKPDEPSRLEFAQAFKRTDATFDPRQERQLQVLACIGLALRLKTTGSHANEAALAILGAGTFGARTEVSSLHLVERAKEHLEREIRSRGGDTVIADFFEDVGDEFDLAPVLAKLAQPADAAVLTQAISDIVRSVQSHFEQLRAASVSAAEAADTILARQEQELGMHWWLTGGRSTHLKTSFKAMDEKTRPLVLANELSEMTRNHLGPASIDALLVRAGVDATRQTSIPDAIMACDPDLLAWLSTPDPSPMTTPVHFAIVRQTEVGSGDGWITAWSKFTEIDPRHAMSELDLAMQFYHEKRLLGLADT